MSKKMNIDALKDSIFNRPQIEAKTGGGDGGGNPPLPPDPKVKTRIKVQIDNVDFYHGNPRQVVNPKYEEIKTSIRNRGLDNPPDVTRSSPDQPYNIKAGGNTRLRAMKELWEETKDPKFYEFDCMFHPYTSERDLLLGHIIENDMSGPMAFIDRARTAQRLKEDLETESGEELSQRELARRITLLGWSIDHSNLNSMLYATEILAPWLSQTFDEGMGRPTVNAIRKMLDGCKTYWDSVAKPEEGTFEAIWQPIFKELDEYNAFDVEEARSRIEDAIAAALDCPVSAIRAEIQGVAAGIIEPGHRPSSFEPFEEPEAPTATPARSVKPAPSLYKAETQPKPKAVEVAGSDFEPTPSVSYDESQNDEADAYLAPSEFEGQAFASAPPIGVSQFDPDDDDTVPNLSYSAQQAQIPQSFDRQLKLPTEFDLSDAMIQRLLGASLEMAIEYANRFGIAHLLKPARRVNEPYMLFPNEVEAVFYANAPRGRVMAMRHCIAQLIDLGQLHGHLLGMTNAFHEPDLSRYLAMHTAEKAENKINEDRLCAELTFDMLLQKKSDNKVLTESQVDWFALQDLKMNFFVTIPRNVADIIKRTLGEI